MVPPSFSINNNEELSITDNGSTDAKCCASNGRPGTGMVQPTD